MSLVVDIHALHTVPPSLINRDDTGSPKTAIFGGVPRQRVSSQSWKRAIRQYFETQVGEDTVGFRSRRLPEAIIKKTLEIAPEIDEAGAIEILRQLFKVTGAKDGINLAPPEKPKKGQEAQSEDADESSKYPTTGALLFLSPHQIERAARGIAEKAALKAAGDDKGSKFTKAQAKEILDTEHAIDMAMFGRMLADVPAYNIDASVQVAHAIGVHESQPEFDYYTAVDDVVEDNDETGAAMIGTTQMMSSTLYRFATVNVEALAENLGNRELAYESTANFLSAFIESMPTGKQNTFANNTLPELVYIAVRDTRSVSLVNAFEEAIEVESGSRRRAAAEALAREERDVEEVYGMKPLAGFIMATGGLGEKFQGLAEAVNKLELSAKLIAALTMKESE
ncbi:type I-E CRISPR-associated protein Cas7/Cse4/CasC [Corynebacterium ulceribovis]|uniref:type I-E CRISPR-associated protein Cas7/Cse4/CasC n=1 Tax=Corynebacterium ulceribovis TaxID=487732 RepID=UPI0003729EAA|nr:type I-E CRISPR-associated protein Cas7/Cse4/CasC [Corynebacterium ulceribovis]